MAGIGEVGKVYNFAVSIDQIKDVIQSLPMVTNWSITYLDPFRKEVRY